MIRGMKVCLLMGALRPDQMYTLPGHGEAERVVRALRFLLEKLGLMCWLLKSEGKLRIRIGGK